jgi:hypothetical protein
MSNLTHLIGETILEVIISDDKDEITFITDKGRLRYLAYGDCCSQSWIETTDPIEDLIGQKIIYTEEHEMDELDELDVEYGNVVRVYQDTLKTEKISWNIEYRNESNGFYGGSLELYEGENV